MEKKNERRNLHFVRITVCTSAFDLVLEWGLSRSAGARVASHSANDDRSLLARDDTGRVFVRHEPNLSSGGQVADIEIGAFLIAVGNGPEKQELLRLISTLV